MEKEKIIIEVLQKVLAGTGIQVSPKNIAKAIVQKLDMSLSIEDFVKERSIALQDKIKAIQQMNEIDRKEKIQRIQALKEDMAKELEGMDEDEKLFANFLRGKTTAYSEVLDII